MFSLENRVALVTGAASGIGAATAHAMAEAGADVVLGWYPPDGHEVEPVRLEVESHGRRALAQVVDVREPASVDALVDAAVQAFGRIDIVVANAGIARTVPSLRLTDEAWNQTVDLNLLGTWRCFRAALPHMVRAGHGRLLANSSVAGTVQGWPEHVAYTASKAGIVGMVISLAIEFGRYGITANAVAPGVIESAQSLDPVNSLGRQGVDRAARNNPSGRGGEASDVAQLLVYLASDEARFMNGRLHVLDGGRSLLVQDLDPMSET
ncbi:MAG: SDR family NAD(P)-dependent oxidoreductase [Candidatus Dormibacteria bacterium]